jgi:hypothetical protein
VLIKEIKEPIFLNFICFRVNFCPRACNNVADVLAAFSAKLSGEPHILWLRHAPAFAQVLVASDLAEPVE